jgi:hypothetical protein
MIQALIKKITNKFADAVKQKQDPIQYTDPVQEKILTQLYRTKAETGAHLPDLKEVGWKHYSQTDEDGILHYLFSVLGTTNKKSVEICAGNAKECNTINLIANHFWNGLLIDGNPNNVKEGKNWLDIYPKTYVYPPEYICKWITRDNINQLIEEKGFNGEVDLLSIDVDGVDYWLWEAIDCISPRVVVAEYQQHLGPDRSWTVPYKEDFSAWDHPTEGWLPNYAGASLAALTKLANKKGYKLVGCNSLCFNAFFVRRDVEKSELLKEVEVKDCFFHERAKWSMQKRFASISKMEWVEI